VQITELEAELIARSLDKMIDLPMVPNAIEKLVVKQVIMAFVEDAPRSLPAGVFNQLISGEQDVGAFFTEEVVREINDRICVPIISKDVQNFIVENICTVMFSSASARKVRRHMFGRALRDSLNADSKVQFATKLNSMIDVPFVSERNEQEIAQTIVDSASDVFETLIPESIRDVLQNTSPEELREVRKNLIVRLNGMINIPFNSEEDEAVYFEKLVDFLLERYGLEKGTKSPAEELEDMNYELESVEIQLEAQRIVNAQKKEALLVKQRALIKRRRSFQRMS
jgi:hypothetical protein